MPRFIPYSAATSLIEAGPSSRSALYISISRYSSPIAEKTWSSLVVIYFMTLWVVLDKYIDNMQDLKENVSNYLTFRGYFDATRNCCFGRGPRA